MSLPSTHSSGGRGDTPPAAAAAADDTPRKRSRHERGSSSPEGGDLSMYESSINPLFLATGPRGGVLDARRAASELVSFADAVDDGVLRVLQEAWAAVAVPADMYWSCPQHAGLEDATAALLRHARPASSPAKSAQPRIPHPRHLLTTFYPVRVEALAARGYQAHRGLVPVALDRKGGKGSKAYNVLPRWEATGAVARWEAAAATAAASSLEDADVPQQGDALAARSPPRRSAIASFVAGIPQPTDRNLYVLVDEDCPVDPFFDVDFSYDCTVDGTAKLTALQLVSETHDVATMTAAQLESALLVILTALRSEVEAQWATAVEQCLVLTSSLQVGRQRGDRTTALESLKLSFHVHFRLANRTAVESVRELHGFMSALRVKLQGTVQAAGAEAGTSLSSSTAAGEEARRAALLLACVDFGVYTRWRAFRLPYNVKAPEGEAPRSAVELAGDDLLAEQLAQLGVTLPDNAVGCAAPCVLQSVCYPSDVEVQRRLRYLMGKLGLCFRFLLPLLPGRTAFASTELQSFLVALTPERLRAAPAAPSTTDAVMAAWAYDLACIVRDASQPLPDGGADVETAPSPHSPFRLVRFTPPAGAEAVKATAQSAATPFDVPMPPMPRSVRELVSDRAVKSLLAEVFACIAPEYGNSGGGGSGGGGAAAASVARRMLDGQHASAAAITAEGIKAHYEASIRAYYVYQKHNKFCFRLQRHHKATYAQLYLTFGSIKLRCYSNDCCDKCTVIPWEAPEEGREELSFHAGYPKFERLAEIHRVLFPPLPASELVRRYGTSVLQSAQ